MSTPTKGSTITNTVHPAFAHPDSSARPNTSTSTVTTMKIQITQVKKMSIVQKISRNGYDVAISMCLSPCLVRYIPADTVMGGVWRHVIPIG